MAQEKIVVEGDARTKRGKNEARRLRLTAKFPRFCTAEKAMRLRWP